jgi:PKD domain
MSLKNLLVAACAAALLTPAAALAAPSASISGPNVVERGRTVEFTAVTADLGGWGTTHDWDMENDGTFDYDVPVHDGVIHTYDMLGTKTIKLVAAGMSWSGGPQTFTAEATKTITVVNAKPEVAMSCLEDKSEAGEELTCEQDHAADVDGEIVKREWDVDGDGFDDGQGDELTRAFGSAGVKTVRYRVTDDDGATAIAEDTVTIWVPGAGPAFEMNPQTVTEGDRVTFTAPLGDGEENEVVYERKWDLDGDGEWDEVGTGEAYRTVSAYYDTPAEVQVRLRIREVTNVPESATLTTQTLVVKPLVEEEPPKDPDNGGSGGGSAGGGTGGGAARVPTLTSGRGAAAAPPVFAPAASRSTAPAAVKKAAAKKKKAKCKTVKAKKGKKARKTCAASKKKSRAKARKRR